MFEHYRNVIVNNMMFTVKVSLDPDKHDLIVELFDPGDHELLWRERWEKWDTIQDTEEHITSKVLWTIQSLQEADTWFFWEIEDFDDWECSCVVIDDLTPELTEKLADMELTGGELDDFYWEQHRDEEDAEVEAMAGAEVEE